MIITFFNNKEECGKSTLTIHVARALAARFFREGNTRKVYIFDTVHNIKNSIFYMKEEQEMSILADSRLVIDCLESIDDFENKKRDLDIQKEDVVFFDLQKFQERQVGFLLYSDFIIMVSDNPDELTKFDKETFNLLNKLKEKSSYYTNIKKIFLTQNKVSKSEEIIEEFETFDYISGLPEMTENNKIENIRLSNNNVPQNIQKFSIDVWKKVNEYKEQMIIN